ncbi:hypothetical protein AVEN_214507-1 [Araneus ventricosus]|uniref:Uncharacterized protein n=1 Tax=Araneus ventricosus TaxID=182803 RepID=A0A4Y2DEC2_ARAVE|nr:hypothetical protein AVEN_214507-1 [Araneus ventricosus]
MSQNCSLWQFSASASKTPQINDCTSSCFRPCIVDMKSCITVRCSQKVSCSSAVCRGSLTCVLLMVSHGRSRLNWAGDHLSWVQQQWGYCVPYR